MPALLALSTTWLISTRVGLYPSVATSAHLSSNGARVTSAELLYGTCSSAVSLSSPDDDAYMSKTRDAYCGRIKDTDTPMPMPMPMPVGECECECGARCVAMASNMTDSVGAGK